MMYARHVLVRFMLAWYIVAGISSYASLRSEELCVWPGFLGNGAPVYFDRHLPRHWSTSDHWSWQIQLEGHGQSSPVIWGSHLYVASVLDQDGPRVLVTCIRLDDGSVVWQHSDVARCPVHRCEVRGHAAPTPVIDSQRIYVLFETGQIIALRHDGQLEWNHDVESVVGPLQCEHGLGASLAQDEANVFALVEHEGPSALLALSKRTGKLSWMAEREKGTSWSSPMLFDLHGIPQLVVNSKGSVTSYAAHDGSVLWSLAGMTGNVGPAAASGGQGQVLVGAFASAHPDGWLQAMRSNLVVEVHLKDHAWGVDEPWLVRGAIASFASPFVYRGLGYWLDHHGRITCVDLESSEVLYSEPTRERCRVTPIADGNSIFCFGESGVTTILEAGRDFRIQGINSLGERSTLAVPNVVEKTARQLHPVHPWSVAVVKGTIVMRSDDFLTCIR